MESKFRQQLKKGVLEMVILKCINDNPTYGYELRMDLAHKSEGLLCLKEGTLYPILYRLEDAGLILSEWQTQSEQGGRCAPKKYYTISPLGSEMLIQQKTEWAQFYNCINNFVGGTEE